MKVIIDGWAWLDLSELDAEKLSWLKDKLTLIQEISPEYRERVDPAILHCWKEDPINNRFGVPREFFFEHLAQRYPDIEYRVTDGLPWPKREEPKPDKEGKLPEWAKHQSSDPYELTFFDTEKNAPASLNDGQTEALGVVLGHLSERPASGGILQAPTGYGKTIFGIKMVQEARKRTIVLVHRSFLLNQWKKKIKRFLPDARIGSVVGDKWKDVADAHIILVMVETVASWVKNDRARNELAGIAGIVLTDEVARISAPTWGPVIPFFTSAKRVGVSANPRRSDKLDKVFLYHIGPKVFTGTQFQMTPRVKRVWSDFKIKKDYLNVALISKEMAVKFMAKSNSYNSRVVEQAMMALDANRKILVFSHSLDHLDRMAEMLEKEYTKRPIIIDFFVGGISEKQMEEAEKADILFSTFQMATDSLDIPALDTVILATPIRSPRQPVGRILRSFEGKKDPIVVDMRCDEIPICREYAESRDKAYESIYKIKMP